MLCIGAHSDDIEIGAGARSSGWIDRGVRLDVHWAVLSAIGPRADEARASAEQFLATRPGPLSIWRSSRTGSSSTGVLTSRTGLKRWQDALRRT